MPGAGIITITIARVANMHNTNAPVRSACAAALPCAGKVLAFAKKRNTNQCEKKAGCFDHKTIYIPFDKKSKYSMKRK